MPKESRGPMKKSHDFFVKQIKNGKDVKINADNCKAWKLHIKQAERALEFLREVKDTFYSTPYYYNPEPSIENPPKNKYDSFAEFVCSQMKKRSDADLLEKSASDIMLGRGAVDSVKHVAATVENAKGVIK